MKNISYCFDWEEDFPPVYFHTSISFLKRCPGFWEAKHGDMYSAAKVAATCVKFDKIINLRERFPSAVLLPVITKNKLPEAFARRIGLCVHTGVCDANGFRRKGMTAAERLVHKPFFTGPITQGKEYILIDDIVTQGGTIAALRRHVLSHGGIVRAVSALALAVGDGTLTPKPDTISALSEKFGHAEINAIIKKYHIANNISELTDSQINYLLRFNHLDALDEKLAVASGYLDKTFRKSLCGTA